MADLQPVLGRPFAEQVAFFRRKMGNLVPTARWDDIERGAHDTAFMVAGAAKADLLSDLAAAVDRSITEGRSLGDFRRDFRAIVERNGWAGWTGESTAGGQAWRTRVIYQTNAATSYSAGRTAQLREGNFSLYVYRHNDSVRNPRPEHQALDGLTLPAGHPLWRKYTPPNGWGCQCYLVGARSPAGARRLGGDPDKSPPAGWDDAEAPGIDEGWDYQPGARVAETVSQMAEKTRAWPYEIAKSYMEAVPNQLRDSLARSYRALPSVADDVRRYASRVLRGESPSQLPIYRTLGLVTDTDAAQAHSALENLDVTGYDYALDASAVRHVERNHGNDRSERRRGQRGVTAADYARLPGLLNDGGMLEAAGMSRTNRPLVRREMVIDGEAHFAVFEVRQQRRTLALQTYYIRAGS